jgi:glycosyltransferase involved in cell wall biosynthesis
MNILHLIENLDRGGAQIRLINDLKFTDRKCFHHVVCALDGAGSWSYKITSLGIPVYILDGFYSVRTIYKLLKIIRQHNIDVIHTQLFFADLYGRIVGWLSRVNSIVSTVQASVYEPDTVFLYSRKRRLIDKYTARMNKRFVAVSNFVKSSVHNRLHIRSQKIDVIPNYVDIDELNKKDPVILEQLSRECSLKPGEVILITVGRLNPAKGIGYLLEALSSLISRYQHIKLLIVGDGPSRVSLETLAKEYDIQKHVRFLGERDDIKELLHLSNIFILPTLSEGMSLSLLEAMAVGLPCIASDIEPLREVIIHGRNGLLVGVKNSGNIRDAIQSLVIDIEKAKQMGQNAKDFLKQNFDPFKQAQRLEHLYKSLS